MLQRITSARAVGPAVLLVMLLVGLPVGLVVGTDRIEAKELAAGTAGYLRLLESDGEPAALQVSITRFADSSGTGPKVDLVSAVHIGDSAYYRSLNRLFTQYDVVLYELIADPAEGGAGPRQPSTDSPVTKLQGGLKNFLELTHQLDEVDYSAANFVHADFTPAQFAASMEQRGESLFLIMINTWLTAMTTPGLVQPVSDVELVRAFFARHRALAFKLLLARQFSQIDGVMGIMAGGEKGSTLITDRNRRALEVLRRQLDSGAQTLAIFYGAGHMVDFAQRLELDFGLLPRSRSWIDAWNLRSPD